MRIIRTIQIIVLIFFALLFTSCKVSVNDKSKLRDLEFTIVPLHDIPRELLEIIDKGKTNVFRKTFTDKENLYIVIGYGEMPTTGYSIEVKELYEAKSVIYVKTWLHGPKKTEEIAEISTFPYIVIKIEYNEKRVIFM